MDPKHVLKRYLQVGRDALLWKLGLAWSATSQRAWNELVVEAGWSTPTWVRHTTTLLQRALLSPPSHTAHG